MAYASKREILAWSMYDFANSAFSTTIVTVLFQGYLIKGVVPEGGVQLFGRTLGGATIWALAFGTSKFIAAAMAPVIGAVCDYSAAKKQYLKLFWLVGCAATAALFFVTPGHWILGSLLFIVANVGFEASISINAAFLPELAPAEKLDGISSLGYGIGYFGGGICLLLNLVMYEHPEKFGLADSLTGTRVAFASVGLWWFLFGLPCMLWVRERAVARPAPGSLLSAGFTKAFETMKSLRRFRTLALLTVSVLLFSAGVEVVISMSTSFGKSVLNFEDGQLIKCFLLIQGVAGVGALATAALAHKVPTKISLCVMLVVWLACLCWAYVMKTQAEFWWLGVVIGIVMGGTQSLSRGLQAQLTPPSSAGEFFGFYGVTQKLAASGASYLFALASLRSVQTGILSIAVLFLAGLWLLWPVDVDKGRRESAEEEKRLQAERAA